MTTQSSRSSNWRWILRCVTTIPGPSQYLTGAQMVKLSLTMAPFLSGAIHVMANPLNQTSIAKLVANGIRKSFRKQCHSIARTKKTVL